MLYVVGVAIVNPTAAPAIPEEERTVQGWRLAFRVVRAVIPPVLLIGAVLGSIFLGIASPTEAGSVGAVGACLLTVHQRAL